MRVMVPVAVTMLFTTFLKGTAATNADSLQATSGLGDTTDAVIRMVGYVYIPSVVAMI